MNLDLRGLEFGQDLKLTLPKDPEGLIPIRRIQLQQWHLRGAQVVRLQEEPMLLNCKTFLLFFHAKFVGGEEGLDAVWQMVGPVPSVHDDLIVVEPVAERRAPLLLCCTL